jgi:rSAM/selenodomain-associated transferase 1
MPDEMRRLVLFAKRPRLGHVKTRLAATMGPEQALLLYRAFLSDQLRLLNTFRTNCELELCADGPWPVDPEFAPMLETVRLTRQGPGDLGRRLLRCFQRAWSEGAQATVVVGTDAPTLPAGHVREALRELERDARAVLVPALDGGYVLLGLLRPVAELFRDVPWGGAHVMRITLERARAAEIEISQLTPWYDVDDRNDLDRLRTDLMGRAASERAPATARVLAGG